MTIAAIHWYTYCLPLCSNFHTSHGTMTARQGIIVAVTTTEGIIGVGEIAPLPAFGGGTLEDAIAALPVQTARLQRKSLIAALEIVRHEVVWSDIATVTTICGLETALLDALGKVQGYTAAALLAPDGFSPRSHILINATIGARSTQEAVVAAHKAKRQGFRCVKLKVWVGGSNQEEIQRVAAVREAIGSDIDLRLDANEAWTLEQAKAMLSCLIPYHIQYIEQPLQRHDLVGMRILRQAIPAIPIAADEAVYDLASVQRILEHEAADILIVKPQLAGGLYASQQIIQEAAQRGVQSVITTSLEAGVGVAATVHLAAALPTVTLACGLATLHLLTDDLIIHDLPIHDSFIAVPIGSGLGIALDREALERYGR